MPDISSISQIPDGEELTEAQIRSMINNIDVQIYNLTSGGKWDLLPHAEFGNVGKKDDPDKLLDALSKLRDKYQAMLDAVPFEEVTVFDPNLDFEA